MSLKTQLVAVAIIVLVTIVIIPSFGQSYHTSIKLDPIPPKVKSGDTITFSGTLHTSDGYALQGAVIYIKDDVDFDVDTVLRTLLTDENGKFYGTWKAVTRSSGAYDIYAVFEGTDDFGRIRSETFSVTVSSTSSSSSSPNSGYSSSSSGYSYFPTKITLNTIASSAYQGQTIKFSGQLTSNGKGIPNVTVYIKDEDVLDFDDYLASAKTDSQGKFSATWRVKDVESSDRKFGAMILQLSDPTLVGVTQLNSFLNLMEKDTIEIYAEFEGNDRYQKSNTCTTQYTSSGDSVYCVNKVIRISSSTSAEDEIMSIVLSNLVPGGGLSDDSKLLYSILSSQEISSSDADDLESMLAAAIQEELGIGTYGMTLAQMLVLLDDPSIVDDYSNYKPKNTQKSSQCKGIALCIVDKVKKIIDGDTLVVGKYTIRLALTNTPEKNESGFKQATSFTSKRCPVGSIATVDQDDKQPTDKYKRTVAKVTCSGNILNSDLLYNGHAKILTQYCKKSEFSSETWAKRFGC